MGSAESVGDCFTVVPTIRQHVGEHQHGELDSIVDFTIAACSTFAPSAADVADLPLDRGPRNSKNVRLDRSK